MPYIKSQDRDRASDFPATPGELNLCLTNKTLRRLKGEMHPSQFSVEVMKALDDYLNAIGTRNYETFNSVMGVLDCVPRELGRRLKDEHRDAVDLITREMEAQRDIFYLLTVAPYEDVKMEDNGDVFPEDIVV